MTVLEFADTNTVVCKVGKDSGKQIKSRQILEESVMVSVQLNESVSVLKVVNPFV